MRVEIREPAGSDVRASVDASLPPGEVRRGDDAVRVGAPEALDADALRTAVATVVRALRDDRRAVSWSIDASLGLTPAEQARAIVEGYRRVPQDSDDLAWPDAATSAMIAEEPW